MPLQIRMTDLSVPQGWVLPDATINSDGVMTAAMVRTLNALSGVADEYIDLVLSAGFSEPDPTSGLGNLASRLVGDTVQFRGGAMGDAGGTGNGAQISQLPPEQRPSKIRSIPTAVDTFNGHTVVVNSITIDDKLGSGSGIPGGVFLSVAVSAGTGKITLFDGLSFSL